MNRQSGENLKEGTKIILAVFVTAIVCIGGSYAVFGSSSQSGDTINVTGSTTVQPLMDKMKEDYEKNSSNIVNITGGGSSAGAKAAIDGAADIGMLSRDPKPAELEKGLKQHVIALDGVAVIVNKSVNIDSLSMEQIKKIYTGEITNWSEVGAEAAKIAVVSREDGSGTRDCFDSVVLDKAEIKKEAQFLASTGAVTTAVSTTPGAIGYISLGAVKKLDADKAFALKVDGVEATPGTVVDGTYKIQRNLVLVTKGDPAGATADFINYIYSPQGKKVIESMGFVNL